MAKSVLSENSVRRISCDGAKVYKEFVRDFPKDEVFHEAFVNARVESIAGSIVPAVLEVRESSENEGCLVLVREYVPGRTLLELMEENPEKTDEYLDMMLSLQLELQRLDASMLESLKDKMARQINSLSEIDEGTRYELLTRLSSAPTHTKLCHGDFRPENIIVDDEGKCHVIDWVHATGGNASADIARTCLILALRDKKLSEKYLDMFCERTATDKYYVWNFFPVVAAAQLTKKRPEEEAELKAQLNICDHM